MASPKDEMVELHKMKPMRIIRMVYSKEYNKQR